MNNIVLGTGVIVFLSIIIHLARVHRLATTSAMRALSITKAVVREDKSSSRGHIWRT
jgi:hypothetical protein